MKKNKIAYIYIFIIIIMLINIVIPNIAIAQISIPTDTSGSGADNGESSSRNENVKPPKTSATIGNSSGSSSGNRYPEKLEDYAPQVDGSDDAISIIVKILSILQVIGVVIFVVALALIGFNSMLGSIEEKAVAKEKGIGLAVGAILITGGITVAKFIISIVEKI